MADKTKTNTAAKPASDDADVDFGADFGDDDMDFGADPKSVRHGVAKAGAISPVLKSALLHTLTEGVERTMGLADIVRGAKVATEKADRPLPAVIGNELRSIEGVLDTVATLAKIGDCPGGFVKDPKTGKCGPPMSKTAKADKEQCPDGQVWSPGMGKCVAESEMRKSDIVISAGVKKRLLSDLSTTIQKAMDLRNAVQGATEADAGTVIPSDLGLHMRGLALGIGQSLGRFASPAAKAFVLVDAESNPTALAKAGAAITLTAEQQTEVGACLEKAIDGLSESMMALDRMPEHDDAADEVPGYVSGATEVAIGSLRSITKAFVVEKAEAEADAPADATADPPADTPADPPADATADPPADTPADPPAAPAAAATTDIAKAIADGVAAAMKPVADGLVAVNKRLDDIDAEGKHNATLVKKMADSTPAPNAIEPDSVPVKKSTAGGQDDEDFGQGWGQSKDDDWSDDESSDKGDDKGFSFD